MGRRIPDRVTVESDGGAVFDRFSSLTITNDLTQPSEAVFEVGDDGAWPELEALVYPGSEFTVLLNGQPRLKGRAEVNEVPGSADRGVSLQLTVRTKMSDARYRSADPALKVEGTSIKDFVLGAYAPLGFGKDDILFSPAAARDLMTGKSPGGGAAPVDLEPIKTEQAKIQPPETIQEAVERHLKRFHMTHWDDPSGKILVGTPDDQQPELYWLRAVRGEAGKANNVLTFKRLRDWSDVARSIIVTGKNFGKGAAKGGAKGEAVDADVDEVATRTGHFHRDYLLAGTEVTSQAHAEAIARRELSARSRRKDAYEFTVDGWTFWNGHEQIPWAHNTTTDIEIDALGAEGRGRGLIVRVQLELGAMSATTSITTVAPGIWVI